MTVHGTLTTRLRSRSGGEDIEENLALACKRCNLAKSAQDYSRFREFARLAFWAPDDWRVSEGELDSLMGMYAAYLNRRDGSPDWHLDRENLAISVFNREGEFTPLLRLADDYEDYRGFEAAKLVVEMRRLLPALIAEIRMYRGEQREAAA